MTSEDLIYRHLLPAEMEEVTLGDGRQETDQQESVPVFVLRKLITQTGRWKSKAAYLLTGQTRGSCSVLRRRVRDGFWVPVPRPVCKVGFCAAEAGCHCRWTAAFIATCSRRASLAPRPMHPVPPGTSSCTRRAHMTRSEKNLKVTVSRSIW